MAECHSLIQGTRLRATRVDGCGAPVGGADAQVVTNGFISVVMKDNVEAPTEFKVKLADGTYCINQRSRPLLNWIDVTITVCQVAPEFFELLTGSPLIYDDATPTPKVVGVATDGSAYASASFALELWTNIARSRTQACTGAAVRYGYLLLPWLVEGAIGDVTIDNGPVSFTLSTITSTGNDWGRGPYHDVVINHLGVPTALIDPIPHDRHRHLQFTDAPPPASLCGYQSLVLTS